MSVYGVFASTVADGGIAPSIINRTTNGTLVGSKYAIASARWTILNLEIALADGGNTTFYAQLPAAPSEGDIVDFHCLMEIGASAWDALFNINLKSVLHTTRHGIAALRESKGCILNTSSLVGVIGQEIHAAYTATKGGMNTLTKSMALDYAKEGIRVNAVCPAGIWTPMLRQWASEQPDPAGISKYLDDIHPLGYCPDGDVIADACVFLLSSKARFVTGHIMHVSGGAEIGYRSLV